MAREKGVSYTRKIEHPLFGTYYIKTTSESQYAVYKSIPSGHELPARSYHSKLSTAVERIVRELCDDKCNLPVEAINLIDYVNERTEHTKELFEGLKALLDGEV